MRKADGSFSHTLVSHALVFIACFVVMQKCAFLCEGYAYFGTEFGNEVSGLPRWEYRCRGRDEGEGVRMTTASFMIRRGCWMNEPFHGREAYFQAHTSFLIQ